MSEPEELEFRSGTLSGLGDSMGGGQAMSESWDEIFEKYEKRPNFMDEGLDDFLKERYAPPEPLPEPKVPTLREAAEKVCGHLNHLAGQISVDVAALRTALDAEYEFRESLRNLVGELNRRFEAYAVHHTLAHKEMLSAVIDQIEKEVS